MFVYKPYNFHSCEDIKSFFKFIKPTKWIYLIFILEIHFTKRSLSLTFPFFPEDAGLTIVRRLSGKKSQQQSELPDNQLEQYIYSDSQPCVTSGFQSFIESRLKMQPTSVNDNLDTVDLTTENLPAVDTPDACDKAAMRYVPWLVKNCAKARANSFSSEESAFHFFFLKAKYREINIKLLDYIFLFATSKSSCAHFNSNMRNFQSNSLFIRAHEYLGWQREKAEKKRRWEIYVGKSLIYVEKIFFILLLIAQKLSKFDIINRDRQYRGNGYFQEFED